MRRKSAFLGTLLLLWLVPSSLLAHDFWIEPESLFPRPGARLDVNLCIGHHQEVEFYARNPRHAAEFHLLRADGQKVALLGEPGAQPAGYLERMPEGPAWLVYRSNLSASELEPARFEAYLREEGLERVIADRLARGESEKPGRERYGRSAKALVVAAASPTATLPKPLLGAVGLPAELLLGANPLEPVAAGQMHLPIQLSVQGAPVEGALVRLQSLDANGEHPKVHRARTDETGIARLPWPDSGRWLATTVHMVRAEGETEFEWQSQFVSVRFDVPTRPLDGPRDSADEARPSR